MVSIQDNAIYITNITNQEQNENDYSYYGGTSYTMQSSGLGDLSNSTSTLLRTDVPINLADTFYLLYEGSIYSGTPLAVNSYVATYSGTDSFTYPNVTAPSYSSGGRGITIYNEFGNIDSIDVDIYLNSNTTTTASYVTFYYEGGSSSTYTNHRGSTRNYKFHDNNLYIANSATPSVTGKVLTSFRLYGGFKNGSSTATILDSTQYYADISNMYLSGAPTHGQTDETLPKTYVCAESTPERCIAKDEVLSLLSSTTTEYVGTYKDSGALAIGDTLQLDGTTDVTLTNVVESGTGPYTYTCTFAAQGIAPTSAIIPDRSVLSPISSVEVIQGTELKVTTTPKPLGARSINFKIVAKDNTVIKAPITTQIFK